jgi:hypothetical protein
MYLQLQKTLHMKFPKAKQYIFVKPFQLQLELSPEQRQRIKKIEGAFNSRSFPSFSTNFAVDKESHVFFS